MAIGERIRFFRNKKGVTQKYLGQVVGSRNAPPMCVWHSMKPGAAPPRPT